MLDAPAGKLHAHAALVLVDAFEIPAEVIVRFIDRVAQQTLEPVPGGEDLPQRPLVGDAAVAVNRDAFGNFDAKILGAGAACFERVQQFRMTGDAGAAADQLDAGALVDVDVPADLAQERGGEQPRHRAANYDGASFWRGATERKNPALRRHPNARLSRSPNPTCGALARPACEPDQCDR